MMHTMPQSSAYWFWRRSLIINERGGHLVNVLHIFFTIRSLHMKFVGLMVCEKNKFQYHMLMEIQYQQPQHIGQRSTLTYGTYL